MGIQAAYEEEKIPTKEFKEEIVNSLEKGLRGAESINDRSISCFTREQRPSYAGIATFLKTPFLEDVNQVGDYDVAFVGVPFDIGTTIGRGRALGSVGMIEERCKMALGSVGMLEYRSKPPYHLSYGQKKRVAIAGILAMKPDIVVLDEPMSYLDPSGQDELVYLLKSLNYFGKTIIVSTHDVGFAAAWADQVILLKDGKLLVTGDPDLLVDPQWIQEAKLHLPKIARLFYMLTPFR